MRRIFGIAATVLASAALTPAQAASSPYELLREKAETLEKKESADGWAYVVSGAVAISLATPAFYLSDDVFARAVYSIGQTASVAAIGYGAYLVLIDNDYTRFKRIIDSARTLSSDEKNDLSRIFLAENARRARNVRKIRVISHGMTAALNFLNAATSTHPELRTALLFLGGVNTLAAVNFAFRKGADEQEFQGEGITFSASPVGVAVTLRF